MVQTFTKVSMAHFKNDSEDDHLDSAHRDHDSGQTRDHHSLGRGLGPPPTTPRTPGGNYALPSADSTNIEHV